MPAAVAFAAGAAVSLSASWLLVSRLERIGASLHLSEALLGILAALAADAPEITSAVSAIASHQQQTGAGVALGSNVFNLAALLGLGAIVAGRIRLHRRAVLLGGAVALWIAFVSLTVVAGALPVLAGLVLAAVVLAAYTALLGAQARPSAVTRRLPQSWRDWLRGAVTEEEIELGDAIRPVPAGRADVVTAVVTLVVVIGASVVMEHAAASLGGRHGVPQIVVGGLILAIVTCLPNAVAGLYLAARGRGAAAMSTSLNSATINVTVGLLLPGAVAGLGARPAAGAVLVAAWYAGLSLAVLALAARHHGLQARTGALVVAAYGAFAVSVLAQAYGWPGCRVLIPVLAAASGLALAAGLRLPRRP